MRFWGKKIPSKLMISCTSVCLAESVYNIINFQGRHVNAKFLVEYKFAAARKSNGITLDFGLCL